MASGEYVAPYDGGTLEFMTDDATIQNTFLYDSGGVKEYKYYQTRPAGTTRTATLEYYTGAMPLEIMLSPSGTLGTFIITTHADTQTADSAKSIVYGTNNTESPDYGNKGLIGNDLNVTWSAFALSESGSTGLDNAEYKAVMNDLYANGSEIVPHRTRQGNDDTRQNFIDNLPAYADYSPENWISHGLGNGARNADPFSMGTLTAGGYYSMDLLEQYDYKYIWAFQDIPGYLPSYGVNNINMLRNGYVGIPQYIIYQNTNLALDNGSPLWGWWAMEGNNVNMLADGYLSNTSLDNMLNQHGVFIWHNYIPDTIIEYKDVYINYTTGDITTSLNNVFAHSKEKISSGDMWNPTATQFCERFIQLKQIEILSTNDPNTYTITNNGDTVNGFAICVDGNDNTATLDGTPINHKNTGTEQIIWMNLPSGTHTLVIS
jgi:hypothetical protein